MVKRELNNRAGLLYHNSVLPSGPAPLSRGEQLMKRLTLSKTLVWAGIALIIATGLIHLIEAPENYEEAAYKGILFFLNAAGALVAAFGIYRGQRGWGWSLGGLIAAGSLVGYVVSRTIGLPGLEVDDEWFEPIGVASLAVEGLFLTVYAYVMYVHAALPTPTPSPSARSSLTSR